MLKVTDYGDVHTRTRFEVSRQRTFAMIKPDAYSQMGKVIDGVFQNGFKISRLKMSRFNSNSVSQFYKEHIGKSFYDNLSGFMTSDVVVGMELVADNAVSKWRSAIGPTNTATAQAEAPQSIRGQFGTDGTKNAVHGADSAGSYKREANFWFGGQEPQKRPMQTTAVFNNCTLCLIKPHILAEGLAG